MNGLSNLAKAVPILNELGEPLLYVGGAVAPLYYEREAHGKHARPTLDVDCVAKVVSYLAHIATARTQPQILISLPNLFT